MNAGGEEPAGDATALAALQAFAAFDQLATMVAVVQADGHCVFANAAFESVLGLPRRSLLRTSLFDRFVDADAIGDTVAAVARNDFSISRFDGLLRRPKHAEPLAVHVIVSQTDADATLIVELIEIEQQTRQDREERAHGLAQASGELIRNLAHEIKNPLGGIRGAAQLLGMELEAPALTEYTQVIIHEADRLQLLVDRLLAPHRVAHVVSDVNIHEVCERVCALVVAEYPHGLRVVRDYDASIPEFRGDREQLIQAVLNVARNAAQALDARIAGGDATLVLRTRIARQVTIDKQRWRLALELHVEDNGPGVQADLRERIFYPLVSGREGGSGLGLTLAQTFVQQHLGTVEFESEPGKTIFKMLIPLP